MSWRDEARKRIKEAPGTRRPAKEARIPFLTREPTRKEAERIALAALVRCGIAAVAQSKADKAWERAHTSYAATQMVKRERFGQEKFDATVETCAAGAALIKAMRAIKGAK
jgi:hypothetical protein